MTIDLSDREVELILRAIELALLFTEFSGFKGEQTKALRDWMNETWITHKMIMRQREEGTS